MKNIARILLLVCAWPCTTFAQGPGKPIIDIHLHAFSYLSQGPYPSYICSNPTDWPPWDPSESYGHVFARVHEHPGCTTPVASQPSDEALLESTLAALERNNVIGFAGGPLEYVERWRDAAPDRILPSVMFRLAPDSPSPDTIAEWHEAGRIEMIGEVTLQYQGITPDDPRFAPWLEKLESIDLPMLIHMGPGPPGVPHLGASDYRARMHSPLSLEEPLMRHPKLRVIIGHAGWPMLDDTLALLWAHPHVYVGIGVINHAIPKAEFYRYLRTLVEAGYGKRILFGSDQMVWPETIDVAVDNIVSAPFLSEAQKRDILYNNAARFFRFSDERIAAHHAL